MMFVSWWRNRRRRRILARPFPDEWEAVLRRTVWHYPRLTETERARLRDSAQVFVNEKYWEGCNGLAVTDEMRVTIAGHACLLLLGFAYRFYEQPQTVLIYPDEYFTPESTVLPGGVVSESMSFRLGEAWQRGPVILAWSTIEQDIQRPLDGHNVILHEFAHVLDMLDVDADGTPPLNDSGEHRNWTEVMSAEFQRLVEDTARGRPTLLDEYGATDQAEFFAVATECFFERPILMQKRHPQLYNLLTGFYRQDPATRMGVVPEGERGA